MVTFKQMFVNMHTHALACFQISVSERRGIPHHLLDVIDPRQDFSAGDFYERARAATEDILQVSFNIPLPSLSIPHFMAALQYIRMQHALLDFWVCMLMLSLLHWCWLWSVRLLACVQV